MTFFFEIRSAPKSFILQRSEAETYTQLTHTNKISFSMTHLSIVQAIYLPSRVTGQEKVQISAGPIRIKILLHPYYINRAVNRQPDFRSGDT